MVTLLTNLRELTLGHPTEGLRETQGSPKGAPRYPHEASRYPPLSPEILRKPQGGPEGALK